jgi:hypothetical protein
LKFEIKDANSQGVVVYMSEPTPDFSHPDIVQARANAYALLLQWRKERATHSDEADQEQHVNPSTNLRNSDSEVYCPEIEESPTPAGSEQG